MIGKELPLLLFQEKPYARQTAEILRRKTKFDWNGGQTWAGLMRDEIIELTVCIANFIGISPDEADIIDVIYADHYTPKFDGKPHICSAFCYTTTDEVTRKFVRSLVVFNRSLELLKYSAKSTAEKRRAEEIQLHETGILDKNLTPLPVPCHFRSPEEEVVWTISEELSHAHNILTASSYDRYVQWGNNYVAFLRSQNYKFSNHYSANIYEVTASRNALRVLVLLSVEEDRKAYFKNLYQESLKKHCQATPCSLLTTFIPTGFRPPTLTNKLLTLLRR